MAIFMIRSIMYIIKFLAEILVRENSCSLEIDRITCTDRITCSTLAKWFAKVKPYAFYLVFLMVHSLSHFL